MDRMDNNEEKGLKKWSEDAKREFKKNEKLKKNHDPT